MAAKRCIPTDLFYQRKFVRLRSDTTRVLLIGLIADADDAGRGLADPDLLGRKLDHTPEQIAEALEELAQAGFVQTYTRGEESYYALCIWSAWQKLSKPTPSRYPAPPASASSPADPQGNPGESRDALETPGRAEETPPEEEGEEEEEKRREREEEAEGEAPGSQAHESTSNVVPFPRPRASASTADEMVVSGSPPPIHEGSVPALTHQVAHILALPVSEALSRLVAEYASQTSLSLLGEADAAREWIDDPRRNKQRKRMSPAFFRSWLKRELEAVARRQQTLQALATTATGTTGTTGAAGERPLSPPQSLLATRVSGARTPRAPDLMHLAEEDAALAVRATQPPQSPASSAAHAYLRTKGEEV